MQTRPIKGKVQDQRRLAISATYSCQHWYHISRCTGRPTFRSPKVKPHLTRPHASPESRILHTSKSMSSFRKNNMAWTTTFSMLMFAFFRAIQRTEHSSTIPREPNLRLCSRESNKYKNFLGRPKFFDKTSQHGGAASRPYAPARWGSELVFCRHNDKS